MEEGARHSWREIMQAEGEIGIKRFVPTVFFAVVSGLTYLDALTATLS